MPSLTSTTPAAALVLALLSIGPALAQNAGLANNTLSIEQKGSGNTLTVNQSAATGSKVGGLEIARGGSQAGQLIIAGQPQFTVADDGTKTAITQSATALVPVFDRQNPSSALQTGNSNSAEVTITGTGGFVGLLQNNQASSRNPANTAIVNLQGLNGTALVGQQNGGGNRAELNVNGTGAFGSVLQDGSRNNVALNVAGTNAVGTISQLGSDNDSSLAVVGTAGTTVNYIVQGNGTTPFNPTEGAQVITNATSVTITQTQFR